MKSAASAAEPANLKRVTPELSTKSFLPDNFLSLFHLFLEPCWRLDVCGVFVCFSSTTTRSRSTTTANKPILMAH